MLQSILYNIGALSPFDKGFKRLIDFCFSCRRCVDTCPAGIKIPDLMSQVRSSYVKKKDFAALHLGYRMYGDYEFFDHLGSVFSPFSNWILKRRLAKQIIEFITHIDRRTNLPVFHRKTFEKWFRDTKRLKSQKKIVYFIDAYANYNRPELGKAVVKIAESQGFEVVLPPQTDSGMPSIEFGMFDKALSKIKYNVDNLFPYVKEEVEIVCSSPAASFLLKEGYPSILNDTRTENVAKACLDISEFINRGFTEGKLDLKQLPEPQEVLYHYCCLSKALNTGEFTTRTLERCGYKIKVIDDCCGSGGVWSTFTENYELGAEVGEEVFNHVKNSGLVLTESETCKMQIELHTGRELTFPTELVTKLLDHT